MNRHGVEGFAAIVRHKTVQQSNLAGVGVDFDFDRLRRKRVRRRDVAVQFVIVHHGVRIPGALHVDALPAVTPNLRTHQLAIAQLSLWRWLGPHFAALKNQLVGGCLQDQARGI